MKKLLFAAVAAALLMACNNTTNKEGASNDSLGNDVESVHTLGNGRIVFEQTEFDFGSIKEGEVVEHTFKFKNEGTEPVILAQVTATCGCTTPDYTKDPILPGKEGEVKVSFNSAGHPGVQQKFVTISSNAENPVTTVQLKGTVGQ